MCERTYAHTVSHVCEHIRTDEHGGSGSAGGSGERSESELMLAQWDLVSVDIAGPSGFTQTVMLRTVPIGHALEATGGRHGGAEK
jgi:hypothetical protein